jgi:rRNA 2'-O-methyltransferase fibrillarin
MFLKNRGHCVIAIKATCVDSTVAPEVVYQHEVQKLKDEKFRPIDMMTLEPYERDHAVVVGMYRPAPEDFPQDNAK